MKSKRDYIIRKCITAIMDKWRKETNTRVHYRVYYELDKALKQILPTVLDEDKANYYGGLNEQERS